MELDQSETGQGGAQPTSGAVVDWSNTLVTLTTTGPVSGGCTEGFHSEGEASSPAEHTIWTCELWSVPRVSEASASRSHEIDKAPRPFGSRAAWK